MNEQDIQGQNLLNQIKTAKSWQNKYRFLMLLGRLNKDQFSPEWLDPVNIVAGCESQVWLVKQNNQYYATSEARIVSGLLYIILNRLNKLSTLEQKNFDLNACLSEYSLQNHISESRTNGLQALLNQVQSLS
ncbi:SufE family protein [Gayadomonas joobiniege]|uniref:SufE family protein n=1 Tax=Gayadomonas joobiniege TaxID=1234606 RepID=UPI000363C55B|nr:SufE family protein [Gayadomonas joobiniege]